MKKGIPIGAVLGAILALVLFRAVEARRAGAESPAATAGGKAAAGEGKVTDEEGKLRAELEAAVAEGKGLEDRLKELETAAGGNAGSKTGAKKKRENPWAEIAAKVYKMRDKLNDREGRNDPEMQDLMLGFLEIAKKLQDEYGISMDELQACPFGLPLLMLGILEASDAPPEGEQAAKFEEMFDKAEEEWKEFARKKEELSALEQVREMLGLKGASMESMREMLTPAQVKVWEQMGEITNERIHVSQRSMTSPDRASVATNFQQQWTSRLGLDEWQAASIGPLVDTYMSDWDRMQAEFAARTAAGEKVSQRDVAVAQVDLMLRTHKRISETVRLKPEQEKMLREWDTVYGFTIGEAGSTTIEER